MAKIWTFWRYLRWGITVIAVGLVVYFIESQVRLFQQRQETRLQVEKRNEDIDLWKECSRNEIIRASERCQRVIDGSCFDIRNLTEVQGNQLWLDKMMLKSNQFLEDHAHMLAEHPSILLIRFAECAVLVYCAFRMVQGVTARIEDNGGMNSRTEENEYEIARRVREEMTRKEEEMTRKEEEMTKKEEEMTRKEEEMTRKKEEMVAGIEERVSRRVREQMVERERDLDFRIEKQVQARVSRELPPRRDEERAFFAGRSWPPVPEIEAPRAPEPETKAVRRASRATARR